MKSNPRLICTHQSFNHPVIQSSEHFNFSSPSPSCFLISSCIYHLSTLSADDYLIHDFFFAFFFSHPSCESLDWLELGSGRNVTCLYVYTYYRGGGIFSDIVCGREKKWKWKWKIGYKIIITHVIY